MKHWLAALAAVLILHVCVYADNTATDNYSANECTGIHCGIHYITAAIDTTDTDLDIYDPASTNTACLVGLFFSEGNAGNLTIKSGSVTLVTFEIAANQGYLGGLVSPICTDLGQDLTVQSSMAMTSILFKVVEMGRFRGQ